MKLKIEGFIWREWVVEEVIEKHGLELFEVETVFFNPPYSVRRTENEKYLFCTAKRRRGAIC